MPGNSTSQLVVGQRAEVAFDFRLTTGALTNPTGVICILRDPSGTETQYTNTDPSVTISSSGFTWTFLTPVLSAPGTWFCRIKATSGNVGAREVSFDVLPSVFTTP